MTLVCELTQLQLEVLWVRNLTTKMALLENVFVVQNTLFIMFMDTEIRNAFFQQHVLQQRFWLAKTNFLVSDSMFCRIWNAFNSFSGLLALKELNVSIRPFRNYVLISNQPFSLWVTATTGVLPVGWLIQNPIILTKVACYKRTQSDFILCHCIFPKSW